VKPPPHRAVKPPPPRPLRRARLLTAGLCAAAVLAGGLAACDPSGADRDTLAGGGEGAAAGERPELPRALDVIQADALRRHVEVLAADDLLGREAFGPGYRAAAEYVARQFAEIGLQPVDDDGDFLETVPFRRARLVRESSSLTLLRNGVPEQLVFGEDYFMGGGSLLRTETEITAPVTFVGYGISDRALGWDDYAGLNVEGRIVLMVFGTPPGLDQRQRTYYLTSSAKQEMAERRGAVGILTLIPPANPVPFPELARQSAGPVIRWLGPGGRPGNTSGRIRAAAVVAPRAAIRMFADTGTTLARALETLESGAIASGDLPVEVSLRMTAGHEELASPNVVALLPGSDPALRDETVVFTAHLDHVGVGPPPGDDRIYNGAYDNASGVAVLIEAARAFSRLPRGPRRSLLFAAVTAEEKGLQGSDHLAAHPPAATGEIVAAINMDMILMLYPPADVIAFGAEHSSLGPLVEAAAGRLGLEVTPDPIPEMNAFFRSDHYSFARRGVPAVMIFPGLESADPAVDGVAAFNRWMANTYHRPSDDPDQPFRWETGVTMARLNVLLGLQVADADGRPTWDPGDFLGRRFGTGQEDGRP